VTGDVECVEEGWRGGNCVWSVYCDFFSRVGVGGLETR
jgi:hypothetical protein